MDELRNGLQKKFFIAPGDYQAILRELGEEALAENAGWLLTHRSRPIEVVKG